MEEKKWMPAGAGQVKKKRGKEVAKWEGEKASFFIYFKGQGNLLGDLRNKGGGEVNQTAGFWSKRRDISKKGGGHVFFDFP